MASISITHIDTCLSWYILDGCNGEDETLISVAVDSSSRCWHVLDGIREEIRNDNKVPEWVSTGVIEAGIKRMIDGDKYHPFAAFTFGLEKSTKDSETVFAWFRVTWDATPDDFTTAYIVAALWSSSDNSDPETGGDPLDSNYSPDDIAPDAMGQILEDCIRFQQDWAKELKRAYALYRPRDGYEGEALAGHDYWLTRNRHGVGFWDRGLGKVGDQLTKAAHMDKELDLYVGDDGKIYGFGE